MAMVRSVGLVGLARKPAYMSANKTGFTYGQDGAFWVDQLDEFSDYLTQGTLDELKEQLADLHRELTSGAIPNVRRHSDTRSGLKRRDLIQRIEPLGAVFLRHCGVNATGIRIRAPEWSSPSRVMPD